MWFSIDNLVLVSAQAACVAAPAAGLPVWAQRFRRRAWALVLPLSIAAVVAAIELLPSTADVLTWVALLLVPTGCGLALGWSARGARPMHAGPAILLLAIAWGAPHTRIAEISTTVLIAGSAVTLGRLRPERLPCGCSRPASWRWLRWTRGLCSPATCRRRTMSSSRRPPG